MLRRGGTARSARTDADGRCRAELEPDRAPWIVCAWTATHPCGEREWRPPDASGPEPSPIEIALSEGRTLEGQVTDVDGNPIGGVTVVATSVSRSRLANVLAAPEVRGAAWRECASDTDGRFTLRGVSDGLHRLDIRAEGWRTFDPVSRREPDGPARYSPYATAGTSIARLVAEAVRFFRVRLRHGDSGAPVADRFARVLPKSLPGMSAIPPRVEEIDDPVAWAGERAVGVAWRSEPLGTWAGAVAFRRADAAPARCQVSVYAVGCRPAVADVRLFTASEILEGALFDDLYLRPEEGWESVGTLRVRARRAEVPFRPAHRRMLLLGGTAKPEATLLGQSSPTEETEFCRVPVGRWTGVVDDGISRSRPIEFEIRAGMVSEVETEFLPPTGAALEVRDPEGGLLSDLGVCAVSRIEGGSATATVRVDPSLVEPGLDDRGFLRPAVLPLAPGRYRCDLLKVGFAGAWTEFQVSDGQVTPVTVTLAPRGREETR